MLFKRNKKQVKVRAAEQERVAKEVANLKQSFFAKLPAELRVQIYEQIIPVSQEIKRRQNVYTKNSEIPSLLHVSRQSRKEVLPLYYGRNTVVVPLQHMTLHRLSTLRTMSSVNLLPALHLWRQIRIESCSRCFHADGFAVLANVDIFIRRSGQGTVTSHPRGGRKAFAKCCQDAQSRYSKRLCSEIVKANLHNQEQQLQRKDFERLARRVDENKGEDNFMAPQRVIPSWSERTGRFNGR